ncbi:hypothetical protein CAPTEDRAFT_217116 [Capitella teleta]|uniref:Uncharacterized protein n=1 Tax=Capitella teleta TaxID=283909 RepID=R7VKV3_CAPTE|nr:hypothetical protein CAPTEDRAFT_217116 [Capitella teleta]|eukprot:ELU17095.1 hypothetical protein CAPTEDRAFT_217116 [Capitella teleta]
MRRLNLLANEGNYKHNIEALKNGRCDIIVARRHGVDKALKENEHLDFIPCEHCLKFVKKYHIWHHLRNCHEVQAESPDDQVLKNALRKGRSLLSSLLMNEAPQAESLLTRMHNGPVKQCAQTDSLIMRYASLIIEALGKKWIKNQMTCIVSAKGSTKQLAFSEVSPALNLAKKIGNLIGHLIVIKLGFELRKTPFDNAAYEATIRFQRIFDAEWRHRINAPATRKLQTANREKVAVIPLTEDLVTLNKHFIKTMKECFIALQQLPDMSTWQKMSRYTMCRLLIFNKRRRAEVKDMLVQSYLKRPKWADDSNQEIRMALSDLDKLLVQRMDLYVARGKSVKNNDAFILLPPDCRQALDLLIKTREVVGISKDNPFIFARQFASSALSGNNELSELAQQCPGIKEPQRISSTALRKYTATVSQVMDLKGSELGMLARHLGHDPKTHKEYYRLTSSTVELSKVSKLLLALEKGEVNQWRGRRLEDITLDELPDVYDDDEEQDGLELDADPASACCQLDEQSMQLPDAYNEDEEHDSTQSTHDNDGLETDAHHSDSCQLDEQMEPDKPQQPMKAKICARYKWSVGETDILMKEYESFINLPSGNRLPGKATVLAFIARVGWKNILYYTIRNKLAICSDLNERSPRSTPQLLSFLYWTFSSFTLD